jgi:dTDP-glucose 4,6-dehydratase
MQTVLITGGTGFIGSNFIPYFLGNNKEFKVVNIDLLTYSGNFSNLTEVGSDSRYTFVKVDICDRSFIDMLFKKYNFTGVIHFAAESHIDNSIKNPDTFIKTNIFGTFNLLDVLRSKGNFDFNTDKPDGTMQELIDVSKLNDLRWKYKVLLENGIKMMYDWY